ncbi:MAG: CoB--CoM heterodisulfide reductase iron-sulfur subunit B family protein [Planctomycetes bacterium]|jgi:heterodisulfide reductase subunit B|nr:CoB--CoM heterodisulfide reductase iron-sulfur subunit B family protein [Planctomycetota bacterium]
MDQSTRTVAEKLGIQLIEPKGWTCCGATAGHQTDRLLAAALPAATLVKVQDMGLELVVNCAACYNRMKAANHEIAGDPQVRAGVADALGRDYDGSVEVRHLLEVLLNDVGTDAIEKALHQSLRGLKVACYYGCLLVRPSEVTGFDDPENPSSLDRLVTVLGGTALEWPHKTECCGGGLSMSRTDVVVNLTDAIVGMAKLAGAECIAVSCPMCQINLDMRQLDIAKSKGNRYDLPVLYLTQLLGLCLGVAPQRLGLNKLMISPAKVLQAVAAA